MQFSPQTNTNFQQRMSDEADIMFTQNSLCRIENTNSYSIISMYYCCRYKIKLHTVLSSQREICAKACSTVSSDAKIHKSS